MAEMRASRPNGLKDVNVGILSGRLVAVPFKTGALSVLLGAGAGVSTETNFMHSYGVDGLVGMKLALNPNTAFRIDGVWDWLANEKWNGAFFNPCLSSVGAEITGNATQQIYRE